MKRPDYQKEMGVLGPHGYCVAHRQLDCAICESLGHKVEPMPVNGPPPIKGRVLCATCGSTLRGFPPASRIDFRIEGPMRAFDANGNEILDPVTVIDVRTGEAEVLQLDKDGRPIISPGGGSLLAQTGKTYEAPITLLPLPGRLRELRSGLGGASHPPELLALFEGLGEDLAGFSLEVREEAEWLGEWGADLDWAFRRGWAAGKSRGTKEGRSWAWTGFALGVSLLFIVEFLVESLCF